MLHKLNDISISRQNINYKSKIRPKVNRQMKNKPTNPMTTALCLVSFLFICFSTTPISAQEAKNRFTILSDGTIHDTKTGLTWANKDNGSNITWGKAKTYCESYSAGGHKNWRMPTAKELATLYGNRNKNTKNADSNTINIITPTISITAPFVWSSEKRTDNKAITFNFTYGTIKRLYRASGTNRRALPVR